MSNWWAKTFQTESFKAMQKLQENQPNSLLQEFMDYENRPQPHQQICMGADITKNGELHLTFQFRGERIFDFNFQGDKAFAVQADPGTFIASLFSDYNGLKELNERFSRYVEVEPEMQLLLKKVEAGRNSQRNLLERLGERVSEKTLQDMEDWSEMQKEVKKYFRDIKHMLGETPFLAERLYATYRAFLAQRTVHTPINTPDPVEDDLVRILENEKLSEQTKEKARSLLDAYKEQKHEKDVEVMNSDEQEAILILSTIEQHYVKGGNQK